MIYNSAHKGLDDLPAAVRRTTKDLREIKSEFDFIAVRGVSGLLVGSPVSLRLNKPLVVVRKPSENSHSWGSLLVNKQHARGRYIFLDDFISSGATEREVINELKVTPAETLYVASYEYCSGWDYDTNDYRGKLTWQRQDADELVAA